MYPACNLGDNKPYREVMGSFLPNLRAYYEKPSEYQIDPFQIFGNLYYVGDQKVCMHLVDTGDGLILFDSGYGHATHFLIASITRLGFDPQDIRYIIHSHGHFDHFGGGNLLRHQYGATVFMSKTDTDLLRERPERSLLHLGPKENDEICWPNREIRDGDTICLGNTEIRCLETPGHTLGTTTFLFQAFDGSRRKNVGYLGGMGFLSVYREYCKEYGLPENKCALIHSSVRRLWDEPVEITLGNHPNHNCTLEKRAWMLEHEGCNPFVDAGTWQTMLRALDQRCSGFEALGY